MKNEPIRHHYIPQFILRNFCCNGNGIVQYYDKSTSKFSKQNIRDVFMAKHLYRDEINTPENPTQIENDLADYEREIANLIKSKFLHENEITLNLDEDQKLRLFFAIMSFRAERVKDYFKSLLCGADAKYYSVFQADGNFEDFWKRNLSKLVKCRSLQEALEHSEIDEPIKTFMMRDTVGLFGMYFAVAERFESENFVIGDTYPEVVWGVNDYGHKLEIYSIYPISPERIILMVHNGAENTPRDILGFRPCVIAGPKINQDGTCRIRVKKMYNEEVCKINRLIIKDSSIGYICKG